MANYWDTFKPGLLAGEDYWEDFTPEAPTETGVVGKVTGKRYQPWEKGYHNIAGLVDDSGEYDAWYDPDAPPETSRPEWGTPEGYENWKTRIGLETDTTTTGNGQTTGSGTYIGPEGVEGSGRTDLEVAMREAQGNDQGLNFDALKDLLGSGDIAKGLLGLGMAGPAGFVMGMYGGKVKDFLNSILDKSYFTSTDTEGAEAPGGPGLGEGSQGTTEGWL